jgi:hypothetical protein
MVLASSSSASRTRFEQYFTAKLLFTNEEEKKLPLLTSRNNPQANMSDCRETPAFHIWTLLEQMGAFISYHDPFVAEIKVRLYFHFHSPVPAVSASPPSHLIFLRVEQGRAAFPFKAERGTKCSVEGRPGISRREPQRA